jgi:hypothetical protein
LGFIALRAGPIAAPSTGMPSSATRNVTRAPMT